jgi:hypothetical protein
MMVLNLEQLFKGYIEWKIELLLLMILLFIDF